VRELLAVPGESIRRNCGMGPSCREYSELSPTGCDRNAGAPAGWLSKGDFNRLYASTIFNVRSGGQGDLVAATEKLAGRSGALVNGSNRHSEWFNVVAHTVSGGGEPGVSIFDAVHFD
jgi:hypothetical protein